MKEASIDKSFCQCFKAKADGGVVTEQSRTKNFLSSILPEKYTQKKLKNPVGPQRSCRLGDTRKYFKFGWAENEEIDWKIYIQSCWNPTLGLGLIFSSNQMKEHIPMAAAQVAGTTEPNKHKTSASQCTAEQSRTGWVSAHSA